MVPFTRILCPIDFSDASQHALEHAVAVAQWYDAVTGRWRDDVTGPGDEQPPAASDGRQQAAG